MRENLAIWCVKECVVQGTSVEYVPHLYNAFVYAEMNRRNFDNPEVVKRIGARVEPNINENGWRNYPVFIGIDEGKPWRELSRLIKNLCEAVADGYYIDNVEQWFIDFERIHPFGDGNGRTGAIIANIMYGHKDEDLKLSWEIHSFQ